LLETYVIVCARAFFLVLGVYNVYQYKFAIQNVY
jgi:hypothetical protein